MLRYLTIPSRILLVLCPLLWLHPSHVKADGCDHAVEAMAQAAKIRKLEPKHPVSCREYDKKQYFEELTALLRKDLKAQRLAHEEILLKLLGLIPQNYQYAACLIDGYAGQAAAYYSAEQKGFVLPAWIESEQAVLVHEATHALQDQYYDLLRLDHFPTLVSDGALAAGALIEGDAVAIEDIFRNQNRKKVELQTETPSKSPEKDCALPVSLEELFYFEYQYGLRFIDRVEANRSIDSIFQNPPKTTEEILHPQKYGLPDEWLATRIPQIPKGFSGGPLKLLYSERMGEFVIRVLLRNFVTAKPAALGAAQWAGDRIALFQDSTDGSFVVGWTIRFDNSDAVLRFYKAAIAWLAKRFSVSLSADSPAVWVKAPTGETFQIARKSKFVRIFIRSATK